ncbi:nitroreductase family deazaflavin-dependent oxidoreductase [Williamsia sp. 1135]|uniref:nitroreductase family deazaflavin-dependent oxidoreductase n=1 Tax=Williamsia sp. 1135 TaxID=1889262 RepID=UPI00117DBFB3|nr:nitroreductase family deazaflavin-dependent oxidoreductase [Williamsia sp. 1135]
MGILTPLAVKIGAVSWMPKMLPLIEKCDVRLQGATKGRVSVLDIAGLPNIVLRVPGRKTGNVRSTPLLCVPQDGGWLIAGSYFGNPKLPVWVLNLRACETAEVVHRGKTRTVSWREITGTEREQAWQTLLDTWPNFAIYEQRTERLIPVFFLAPGLSKS